MSQPPSPPPSEGRVSTLLNAVRGLTLTNVLVIALLVTIAIPAYIIYRALNDEKIMDRLMTTYEEEQMPANGCLIRHVQQRGGPDQWGVSSGFAYQGTDRWFISVILSKEPTPEQAESYCQSLKLIADRMKEP